MATQVIKDAKQVVKGYLVEDSSTIKATDEKHRLLATYSKSLNETRDAVSKFVGKGDLTARFIPL